MIKISRQITHLFFLFAVIACSHQPITSPDEEAIITKNKPVLPKAPSKNQSPKTQQTPEKHLTKSSIPPIEKNDKITQQTEQTSSDQTLSNKELDAERFLIATPKKDPSLSDKSSKHANELKPEKRKTEMPLDDDHQEPSLPQTSTKQAKTEQQKSENNQQKNQASKKDGKKNSKKDKQDHGSQSTKQKAKDELNKTNNNISDNRNGIKSDVSHNNQASEILSKTERIHNEKSINGHGHEGHDHEDHDHHHEGHIDADHEHAPKKNKKQHWNMQRIIKPNIVE